jgi:hypothetical protein
MKRIAYELLQWIPVGLFPLANGMIRIFGYSRWLGEPYASFLSSGCDVLVIAFYARFLQGRRPVRTRRSALSRGALWLGLSTLDHFALGYLVFGMSLSSLAAKYNPGRLETWGFISLVILMAPFVAWRIHGPKGSPSPGDRIRTGAGQ